MEINFTVNYLQLLVGDSEYTSRAKPYDIQVTDSDNCIKYKLWSYFEKTLWNISYHFLVKFFDLCGRECDLFHYYYFILCVFDVARCGE